LLPRHPSAQWPLWVDRHPNRDTTNATDRFLGPIADKSLVMWTTERDGDGYVAAATIAVSSAASAA
jgi:hypothetical protein